MDEGEALDAGCLCHARGAEGAALAGRFAVGVHDLLVVPAHAEHEVGVFRQLGYGVAGLGVAGEDDASGGGVEAVCEGVEEGLDVLGGGCCDLPVGAGEDGAGADVGCGYVGRPARKTAAAVLVDALAEGVADARLPVVGEDAFVFVEDSARDALGEGGAEDLQVVFLAGALVPAAEEEAGEVYVVVEVVVGEEEVVYVGGPESCLDELVGCGGAAVHHHLLVADFESERGAEAGGCGCGRASAEDVDFCPFAGHNLSSRLLTKNAFTKTDAARLRELGSDVRSLAGWGLANTINPQCLCVRDIAPSNCRTIYRYTSSSSILNANSHLSLGVP